MVAGLDGVLQNATGGAVVSRVATGSSEAGRVSVIRVEGALLLRTDGRNRNCVVETGGVLLAGSIRVARRTYTDTCTWI